MNFIQPVKIYISESPTLSLNMGDLTLPWSNCGKPGKSIETEIESSSNSRICRHSMTCFCCAI